MRLTLSPPYGLWDILIKSSKKKHKKITIENLPQINSSVRKMILKLIGRANQSGVRETKTDDGRKVELIYPQDGKRCVLKCEDGELEMPAFILKIG